MILFLPIKPEYASRIVEGTKLYEFRKSRFKTKPTLGVIYASSPVCRVVAVCSIPEIFEGEPADLWDQYADQGGIDKEGFFAYYGDKPRGYALKISEVEALPHPFKPADALPGFIVPQSFCYLSDHEFRRLVAHGHNPGEANVSDAAD